MANKIIITNYHGKRISALYLNGRIVDVETQREGSLHAAIGEIYVGKVSKISPNINAAFVNIGDEECYYSLADNTNPIFVNKISKKDFAAGDELLVQVEKEAQKNKLATVTSNISINGTYVIVHTTPGSIGVSKKLPVEKRDALYHLIRNAEISDLGVIVRTNAASCEVSEEMILEELHRLSAELRENLNKWAHRTCYSCLKSSDKEYLSFIKSIYHELYDEIETDLPEVYNDLLSHVQELGTKQITLYQDASYPLVKLFPFERDLSDAMKQCVWLKSGASIVIQPTEALTVIDVNSGKITFGKDQDTIVRKINEEAAVEIAHQIRLRNLSGIILIDFVNLSHKSQERKMGQELMERMKELCAPDPIPTTVVDMTVLGLMEITRKKVKKPLSEQLKFIKNSVDTDNIT